ncbi:MAG TPA: preprotein translocase subunit YajC [Coriobacteriia bacterium]|nr:preprotein translocase subunit YajC [Coriobacteriia bacterium]
MPQEYGSLLSFAVLALAFYFLLIRPQMRRQKEQQALIKSLAIGDRVVTVGGLYGRIIALTDDTADIEISASVVVTYARSAIAKKVEA